MPKYQYRASNMTGAKIEGVYEANDEKAVRTMLRDKAFYPIEIKMLAENVGSGDIKLFSKIPVKVLTIFCQQFAAILRAGVPLTQGLFIMSSQTENKILKKVIADVYEQVQTGRALSEAFRDHEEKFPSIFFSILEAGEMSGTLDEAFSRMGINFEKDYKLQSKIKNALTYPVVVGVVAIIVVIYLLAEVVPTFTGIFEGAGAALPAPTKLLMGMSDFVRNNYILLGGMIMLIAVGIRVFLKTHTGRFGWDKNKLNLPVFGKLIRKIVAARFTRTLCTLFSAGVPLTTSLEVTSRSSNNLFVEEGVVEVAENVKQGRSLADTLEELDVFPPMVVHMTRVGEESGTLEDMLQRTSDFYTDEANDAITRMMSMLEPLIIVVLGGIVLFIVVSILLPMFQMMNIM